MWLLSTDRAELRWFTDASAVPGGYAILSHTWGTHEQTFQEVRAIGERCKAPGKNPRNFVSHKIRKCCLLAEEYGYGWVWVDSCCIDKTSSTELSEAINSMFKWYWQAEVCFAFLADVPSEGGLHGKKSAFRESRWHKRGWTLQELIAPAVVIFLSKDWVRLGTKAELAKLLEEITHVPLPILTRKEYYHQTSVANRMRWAANRMTTRAEDQAYCLMGLFDVSMTVIYGEGTRAFQRLQHKIMKHGFSDMSLFAWGSWLRSDVFRDQGLELALNRDIDPYDDSSYLLAPSPASFLTGFDFTPLHPHPKQSYPPPNLTEEEKAHGAPFNGVEVPTARLDNYGVVCRLPVFEADGVMVAVLLCENESHQHVGLLLNQDPTSYDPILPMYYASAVFNVNDNTEQDVPMTYRLVKLGDDLYNLRFNGKAVKARWHTLHIQPRPQAWFSPDTSIARLQLNCGIHPAFRIPHWLIAKFAMLGFQLVSVTGEDELPLRILLSAASYGEFIHLDLGLCAGDIDNPQSGAHWARVLIHHDQDTSKWNTPHDSHDCNEHHVASWSGGTKLFGDDSNGRGVQLSFAPCTLAAVTNTRTLAVHIELKGSVYADIEYRVEATRDPKLPGDLGPHLMPAASSEASGSPWPTYLLFVFMGATSWPLLAWLISLGTAV